MMILAGPIYRGHISVMTILFLSTVVLSGPAWCSHLCYFGAIDNLAASGKTRRGSIKYRFLKLSPTASRKLYLLITISLHAATMALARI